jgi:hypothetical protein
VTSTYTEEVPRDVTCPSCGGVRRVSRRHARRNPQNPCPLCRRPQRRQPPTDSDRRFWLRAFSDDEIIDIVLGMFDQRGDIEVVRAWRSLLMEADVNAVKVGWL